MTSQHRADAQRQPDERGDDKNPDHCRFSMRVTGALSAAPNVPDTTKLPIDTLPFVSDR